MARRAPRDRPPALPLADLLTISDHTDRDGRLLLEDSAPAPAIAAARERGIAMRDAICDYAETPTRVDGRMNVSAYEALRHDTAAVLAGFAWLHRRYVAVGRGTPGSVRALADISKLGVTLPLVAFNRAADPVPHHGALPPAVASLFKASRGVYSAAFDLQGRDRDARIDADAFVAFADEAGHLRRPQTGRVCAAPTRLISRTIAVALDPTGAATDDAIGEVVDFDTLWTFHGLERRLGRGLDRYRFTLRRLTEGRGISDPETLFAAMVRHGNKRRSFGDYTDAFVREMTRIQSRLNRVLGRATNAPAVTFQDVLAAL